MAGDYQGAAAFSYGRGAMPTTPTRLYIAALGGEGGSVLTSWIVAVAKAEGWPVQSTSVPGVAQRTGATSYYIEIIPGFSGTDARPPVFALTPTPGFVEVVVATELLEAGRAMESGFVSPNRTTLIASRHRTYTINEKVAMADDRYPNERILKAIEAMAARAIVLDLAAIARDANSIVNSVVLGVICEAGLLPIAPPRFEEVLRKSGVAVEANLRGFKAGRAAVRGRLSPPAEHGGADPAPASGAAHDFPAEVRTLAEHGVARLTDYQGAGYAREYLRRLEQVLAADRANEGQLREWQVSRETARYLALWMSYEDIIRVAALKTSRDRWRRIHEANPLQESDTLRVTEFLKPGVEELCSIMTPSLGRRVTAAAARRGKLDAFNFGMKLRTTSVFGFLVMRLLARLKPWRRHTYRFHQETTAAEGWLNCVRAATRIDYEFGVEVVECARLRKGYGSTHRRGAANFDAIMEHVVRPAIAAGRPAARLVAEMRNLALADPEGSSMLDAVEALTPEPSTASLPAARAPRHLEADTTAERI